MKMIFGDGILCRAQAFALKMKEFICRPTPQPPSDAAVPGPESGSADSYFYVQLSQN
jgi:hypothetical protein